ncbi:hypothetical protein [Rubritalea tangerina]|uniref:hypothetical protein n=1 Tax=Rubritalea tangerina TaxID=430798 RepID=UPI003606CC3A
MVDAPVQIAVVVCKDIGVDSHWVEGMKTSWWRPDGTRKPACSEWFFPGCAYPDGNEGAGVIQAVCTTETGCYHDWWVGIGWWFRFYLWKVDAGDSEMVCFQRGSGERVGCILVRSRWDFVDITTGIFFCPLIVFGVFAMIWITSGASGVPWVERMRQCSVAMRTCSLVYGE